MQRYAMFNEAGRSTVISNVVPDGEESAYFPVPENVLGAVLVKEGKKIRDLSAKELEAQKTEMLVKFYSKEIRSKRDRLLTEADVLTQQDRWESYSEDKKKIIAAYKQELRDITKQKGFPKDVTFPELPKLGA